LIVLESFLMVVLCILSYGPCDARPLYYPL